MEFWLTEKHTEGYSVNWKVRETLHTEITEYQHLAVVDTYELGKALILDGIVQTTEMDEFIYHEMIAHPAMLGHPKAEKILVIGGGDGGTIREVVKHPSVKQADLVEIDEKVILACRKYLPEISCALTDPRVRILIEDGTEYIKTKEGHYDLIIIDSSDPVGPNTELFGQNFYSNAYKALKEDGLIVAQSESPVFYTETTKKVRKYIANNFPVYATYLAAIPTYTGGFWSFTIGSKEDKPLNINADPTTIEELKTRYLTPEILPAAFALPQYIKSMLE
ncbi:MAG: polyamine aminopropyltransferase [Bacillota bacterium]